MGWLSQGGRPPLTVSGQNTIGIYIILLAVIQNTAHKQNTVCNNQLLKLQPAVTKKMLYATTGCKPAVTLQFCNTV